MFYRWSRILPLDRSSGVSAISLDTQEILVVATQERMTRRIRQLDEEKLFEEMQASKELDKRRKTPEQSRASSITILKEENISLKEQVRKLTEQVQLLMTSSQERGAASSAESTAEWQRLAETQQ